MLEKMEYGSVNHTFFFEKNYWIIGVLLYANAARLDGRGKEGEWIIFIPYYPKFENKFYISTYNIFKTKQHQGLS